MPSGKLGETAAAIFFRIHGWTMFRTQPETTIIKTLSPNILKNLARTWPSFFGRIAFWGYLVLARMRRGGIADFTGYDKDGKYVACEVKEAQGDSMPCSRLEKDQKKWLWALPGGSAWVGIYWLSHGRFTLHEFKLKGSYTFNPKKEG